MAHSDYLGFGGSSGNYRIAGGMGTRMMEYANFLLMLLNEGEFKGKQILSEEAVETMLNDQIEEVLLVSSPYQTDPLRKNYHYGLGCWIEEVTLGEPTAFGCQGAFGFSPWIDKKREIIGVLFVKRTLGAVNSEPTPETAPYTLIRHTVAEILNQ